MPLATVHGVHLYSERRGRGPSVLFIQGATGLIEDDAYPRYRPDDAAVSAIRRPVHVLVGEAGAPWAPPMAAWLAGVLGTGVQRVPGGYGAYLDDPAEFAVVLRPLLGQITSATTIARPERHTR